MSAFLSRSPVGGHKHVDLSGSPDADVPDEASLRFSYSTIIPAEAFARQRPDEWRESVLGYLFLGAVRKGYVPAGLTLRYERHEHMTASPGPGYVQLTAIVTGHRLTNIHGAAA